MKKGLYVAGLFLAGVVGGFFARPEYDHYMISYRLNDKDRNFEIQEVNIYEDNRKLSGKLNLKMIGWDRENNEVILRDDNRVYRFEYNSKKLEGVLEEVVPEEPKELVSNENSKN